MFQRDLQAVGDKRNEDVCIDTIIALMVDRADGKVVFEFFEGLLDFGQLNVVLPQLGGIFTRESGAQQITACTAPHLAQFGLVQGEGEGARIHRLIGVRQTDAHQAIGSTRFLFGGPQFEQQLIPRQLLLLHSAQALPQPLQTALTHATFFVHAPVTARQDVEFAVVFQEFDINLLSNLLPG